MKKKILDVTCGSRTIWFNKQHPAAVYCDVRDEECSAIWKSTSHDSERKCIVHPDVQCDFTDLPFPDNTFSLVVFDPPHTYMSVASKDGTYHGNATSCSVCHEVNPNAYKTNYCPNCGAKMDGVE